MEIKLLKDLPEDFSILKCESKIEGFNFLEKMSTEWDLGNNRFNKIGEALFGIFIETKIIGVGGINIDPYSNDPLIGRVRHLYVLNDFRKKGVGTLLLNKILDFGSTHFSTIRLRTDTFAASNFYENYGFIKITDPSASHQLIYIDK